MITALKQIGDYSLKKSQQSFLEQIVDNPNSNGKYNTVLIIVFVEKEKEIYFEKIEMQEFTREKLGKYAYKKGSPRGGDLTPTSKITDIEKTFERIQKPLKKLSKSLKGKTEEEKEIIGIFSNFKNEETAEKILDYLKKAKYTDNAILTIGLRKNSAIKYVGDFKLFIEQLKDRYEKKFYYKSSYQKADKKSIGKDNVCYICGKKAKKTYGYVSTFKFYTLDKVGFSSGGFKRGDAWKNYPVCPECAVTLDQGRKYVEKNLSAKFAGLDYFIIPKTIFGTDEESEEYMFSILEELEEKRNFSLKKSSRAKLTRTENDLFSIMQDFKNYVNFNLMFYNEDKSTSAFRILLYIEDVLPSYISKIFQTKEKIDSNNLYHNLKGKEGKAYNLEFTFNIISDFFPLSDYEKTFLEVTNAIFTQKKISYKMLINRFTEKLRERFRQGKAMNHLNLEAFMLLEFLHDLGLLLERREGLVKMKPSSNKYGKMVEEFFTNHPDFFDNDIKRAIFLEGVLAQKLLNIQYTDRNAAPFKERLNGLKINEKIAKRLLPEIQNKLDEYDKNYYKGLEEIISQYMLEADFTDISNTEMSFYFTTGMNLANQFKLEQEEKNQN